MKNRLIKVAAAIPGLRVGDVTYNEQEIVKMIRDSADCGLLVFPELCITGYTSADLFLSDLLLEKAEEALVRIAHETEASKQTVVVGVPIRYENGLYNCGAVLSEGKIKALIPKTYLPNYSEFYECRWFASGKGIAANAGHEHPALRRADGAYELQVYRHSPAVATMGGMRFREHSFELNPGDSLFVYTDGVAEATSAQNELFGSERMIDALNVNPGAEPEEVLSNVMHGIDAFVADAEQFDDITMLCLKYNGPADRKA